MKVIKNKISPSRFILIFGNALLCFIVAFLIGNKFVAAQIKYFDEPETTLTKSPLTSNSETSYELTSDSPYTAQFPEFKDQLSSTITPENPGPNKDVKITVEVYSFDINSATVTWTKDGKVQSSGIGMKNFSFKTGASGVETKIQVTIDPRDRPVVTETYTFKPGETDILWQAQTYTPPFYKGKSLYTPEASVLLVAMPRSKNGSIRPQETVFNWIENYEKQADKSGVGKNTYLFEGPIILRPRKIGVETYAPSVAAGDQKEIATAEITLAPLSSSAFIYEDNPALGTLFNRAIQGTLEISVPEMQVAVYPYFQSILNKNSGPEYTWVIDGSRADISKETNSIGLKKSEGTVGQSSVLVEVSNPFKILQTTSAGFDVHFDNVSKNPNTKAFGDE